ncbi:hypothetical protein ACFW17_10595 [Streptomyces sp. NPDC058961]|uniref:hypothetical protein n=1 Tax=Streptomyces sp. NPDC058961 TaxID=3346680 RepID=UPI003676E1BE
MRLNPLFASTRHFSLHKVMHDAPPAADAEQEERKPDTLVAHGCGSRRSPGCSPRTK